MFKYECTYTNYFGEERTEAVYFQLSRPEIMEIATSIPGGFEAGAMKMINNHDDAGMFDSYQKVIAKAYGEISDDGRRFVKSPELSKAFMETPIYEKLFDDMLNPEFQQKFITQICPVDSQEDVASALSDFLAKNVRTEEPTTPVIATSATN